MGSLVFTLACGARTGLLAESDTESPGLGDARGGSGGGGGSGTGGGGAVSVGPPPVRTNCQLTGDDPRVAGIKADELAKLNGADFVIGDVKAYHWSVQMEDCDGVVQDAQFTLRGVNERVLTFQPSRPAFYHFVLDVTGVGGDHTSCNLEVPVEGVGMRVELCWDTSTSADLDLYVHSPFNRAPWFRPGSVGVQDGLDGTTCNTSNAAAMLRFNQPRLDWGYPDSALGACNPLPFQDFLAIGRCPNPRTANDNNQQLASGTTERIQLDNPTNGQQFRVMVQNFNAQPAHPHVFVYCGGQRAAAFDAPANPSNFVVNNIGFGLMWRAADITTNVDAAGKISCSATSVNDAVTINDPRF